MIVLFGILRCIIWLIFLKIWVVMMFGSLWVCCVGSIWFCVFYMILIGIGSLVSLCCGRVFCIELFMILLVIVFSVVVVLGCEWFFVRVFVRNLGSLNF